MPAAPMSGYVVEGRRLGRLLGVPTANIALVGCDVALYGSWAAVATTGERDYRAIAHVGVRPSVGDTQPLLEVHLFEFDGDLYGHHVRVRLLRKVSDEVRLDSFESLRIKIDADVRAVRRYFEGTAPQSEFVPVRRAAVRRSSLTLESR